MRFYVRASSKPRFVHPGTNRPAVWRAVARTCLPSWATFDSAPQFGGRLLQHPLHPATHGKAQSVRSGNRRLRLYVRARAADQPDRAVRLPRTARGSPMLTLLAWPVLHVPDPRHAKDRPPGGKSPLPAAPPRGSLPGNMTDPPYPLGARRPTAPWQARRSSHAPLRKHGGPRADGPRQSASGDANPRTETAACAWQSDARGLAGSS